MGNKKSSGRDARPNEKGIVLFPYRSIMYFDMPLKLVLPQNVLILLP